MTTSQLSTDMLTLKEYESTDNLATCALPGRAETEYILCKISSSVIGGNGLVPPTLVDRKELNETFHQSNAYRLQRQNLMNSSIPRNMHHMRIENARLKREMKVMENELNDMRSRNVLNKCQKSMHKKYRVLNKELVALKEESVRILLCGIGDQKILDRIQAHFEKMMQFFNDQLEQINWTDDSTWSPRYRTLVLEYLMKLFERNILRMDKWIDWIVDSK